MGRTRERTSAFESCLISVSTLSQPPPIGVAARGTSPAFARVLGNVTNRLSSPSSRPRRSLHRTNLSLAQLIANCEKTNVTKYGLCSYRLESLCLKVEVGVNLNLYRSTLSQKDF